MFSQKDKADIQRWGSLGIILILAMLLIVPSDLSRKTVAMIAGTTTKIIGEQN